MIQISHARKYFNTYAVKKVDKKFQHQLLKYFKYLRPTLAFDDEVVRSSIFSCVQESNEIQNIQECCDFSWHWHSL